MRPFDLYNWSQSHPCGGFALTGATDGPAAGADIGSRFRTVRDVETGSMASRCGATVVVGTRRGQRRHVAILLPRASSFIERQDAHPSFAITPSGAHLVFPLGTASRFSL